MPGLMDTIASGAKSFGSNLAQGVGNYLVERTEVGPLFDPFIETTREKKAAKQEDYLNKMQDLQLQKGEEWKANAPLRAEQAKLGMEQIQYSRDRMKYEKSQRPLKEEAAKIRFENEFIKSNEKEADKNTRLTLEQIPEYQGMNDIERQQFERSEPAQNWKNFLAMSRVGFKASQDPKYKDAFVRIVEANGMDHFEKDGKQFVTQPGSDKPIELTDQNFVKMLNGIQQQAAEELKAHARMIENKATLKGQSINNMAKTLNDKMNALSNTESVNNSKALREVDAFMKSSRFDQIQMRKHWARVGLDKIFEDDIVDANERQEVEMQLQMIGQAMGIKQTMDAEGNIMVKDSSGNMYPLKAFAEGLKEQDEVQIAFDKQFGVGEFGNKTSDLQNDPTAQWMDDEGLIDNIPEEYQSSMVEAFKPMMSDPKLMNDKKKRKTVTDVITKVVDYAGTYEDPEIQYKALKTWAEDEGIEVELLYEYLPENIKVPIGMAIAKEAESERDRALKKALESEKKAAQRKSAFSRNQDAMSRQRKALGSGYGF